eukprot:3631581-Alexandrium_andersonii.AAC.1
MLCRHGELRSTKQGRHSPHRHASTGQGSRPPMSRPPASAESLSVPGCVLDVEGGTVPKTAFAT